MQVEKEDQMKENGETATEVEEDEETQQQNSWLYKNKGDMIKIVVISLVSILVLLIGWKMYSLNQ